MVHAPVKKDKSGMKVRSADNRPKMGLSPDVGAFGVYLLRSIGEAGGVAEQPSGLATVEVDQVLRRRAIEVGVEGAGVGWRGAGEGVRGWP